MKSVYWNRFLQRVAVASRTGLASLLIGLLLYYVKGLRNSLSFSTFAPVIAICVCEASAGKVLRNLFAVAFVSVFVTCSSMLVFRILRPPMHFAVSVACIGVSSFIVAYPATFHLLGRKIGLAQIAVLYVRAHVDPEMDIIMTPIRLFLSSSLGTACAVTAILLPYPRLAVWEVVQCTRSTAHSTSELFRTAVTAFSASDASTFAAMRMQSKMLMRAVSDSLAELQQKQAEIWWELKACFSKRSRFTNMTVGLTGINRHLMGMEMALESGHVLFTPAILRSTLEQPLLALAEQSRTLLETATKDLNLLNRGSSSQLIERKLLMEQGKLALIMFDNELLSARKRAYYAPTTPDYVEEVREKRSGSHSIANPDDTPYVHRKFMARLTVNFFIFNLRLYLVEAFHMVDADFRIFTSMHEVVQVRKWVPARLSRIKSIFREPVQREKSSIDLSESPVTRGAEGAGESSGISSHSIPCPGDCSRCSSPRKDVRVDRWKWLRYWAMMPNKAQALKSFKISLALMLATVFGILALPNNVHACWGPITVSFIIGNLQGGSFRMASLRIQGTVVGSIFGYLVVSSSYRNELVLPMTLAIWVTLSDYIRYSKTHGYSGLVSALTASIMMLGDYQSDVKNFAMDRIAQTFIGCFTFVVVEILVFPERAVVLVRQELLSSMVRLRDCVAAIVAVYTTQGCKRCRNRAVDDIRKLEQQLRASVSKQTVLQVEAALEPDLWFVPFPGDLYSRLITLQTRMLDLFFFMACALQATTQDVLDDHMQKLLKPLRSSLTALKEEVLSTIDSLQMLLQRSDGNCMWPPAGLKLLHHLLPCGRCWSRAASCEKLPTSAHHRHIFSASRKASRALLALGHRRRSVGGTPMRLKTTLERFESAFENVMDELIEATETGGPDGDAQVLSNSAMLSVSSLSFCLHSILQETAQLEKAVWEVLQAENPVSVVDYWDEFGPTSKHWLQRSDEPQRTYEPQP